MARVLGVKCSKDSLDWAVVEGVEWVSAAVVDSKRVTAPEGSRGDQLVWIRREVQELLDRFGVAEVVVRVVEPGGQGNSLPRAEVEGVVQEAVAALGVSCRRVLAVSMRSAFAARSGAQLQEALSAIPAVASTPKTRQDPVTAALVAIKA